MESQPANAAAGDTEMTAAVFGILSAAVIGTSDFVAAYVGRKVGPSFTLLYSMIMSFVILAVGEVFLECPLFRGWDWAILFLGVHYL